MPLPPEDRALLVRLADPKERPAAWTEFLERYSDLFYSILLRRLGSRRYDQDLVRDGYLFIAERLLEKLPGPDALSCKLSTWLFAVTGNLVVDFLRSRLGRHEVPAGVKALGTMEIEVHRLLEIERMGIFEAYEVWRSRTAGSFGDFWSIVERVRESGGLSGSDLPPKGPVEIPLDDASEDRRSLLDHLTDGLTPLNGMVASEEEGTRTGTIRLLRQAVEALPEPQRSLVVGRFLAGRKPADLAREVGLSAEQVSRELYRALIRLRKSLEILSGTSSHIGEVRAGGMR